MRNVLKPLGRALAMTIAAGSIVPATGSVSAQTSNEAERNRMLVARGLQAWADGTGSPYDLMMWADNRVGVMGTDTAVFDGKLRSWRRRRERA